jgi:hypothetical protein
MGFPQSLSNETNIATRGVFNTPTLNVNRNQTIVVASVTIQGQILRVVNFIGAVTVTLDATGLPANFSLLLINTGGKNSAQIIGAGLNQTIASGAVLGITWNGNSWTTN